MAPLEFLAAVLPSTGVYCAAELTTRKREHFFSESLEAIAEKAYDFDVKKRNAYFALASFKTPGSRMADNAALVRSLWVDVDCGLTATYKTKREAAKALGVFLKESRLNALGDPWVVDSGGGLHVYWPFTDDIPVPVWFPVAEQFKRMCKALGFAIDHTCTSDAARVLRLPGTFNRKYAPPKPVILKSEGNYFDFTGLAEAVGVTAEKLAEAAHAAAEPAEVTGIEGTRPQAAPTATQIVLLENSIVKFKDIMVKTAAGEGCGQLAYYAEHAREDGMEPLWRGMLSIAKVCEDADKACAKLSAMHPYPETRMRQKLKEIKGPYPCAKFDSENPGVCPSCPHWGRITNPLALGRAASTETEPKQVVVEREGADAPVVYSRPPAPRGFSYGTHGGVYKERVEDGEKLQILVVPYDLFIVDVLRVAGIHSVHMVAVRPDGTKDVTLPTKALVSKDDAVKALAEQNILASFGAGNDKNLFDYVRAAYEDAGLRITANNIPSQYGWQQDGSFVCSGKILYPDGTSRVTPMPGLENVAAATKPAGTLDGWREVMQLLVKREMYDILTHGCIGFGSPLMCFTGMRGMTFHAGHKESGTGKSLALSVAASIWGHPVDYRTGKSTSPVAMQQRAGNLNSLPFVSDELTMRARGDAEWFPSFVFDFSEGRGKERMEASLNRERVNTTTWCSLAMFTSNTRMLDYMSGVRQHSSEGEIRRFLEWSPSKRLIFSEDEQRIVASLNANYGVAGEAYARWLVKNRDKAKAVTQRVREELFHEFSATNDERFWVAGAAAVVAGAVLAGPKYANIVTLPVHAIKDVMLSLIKNSRKALAEGKQDAEDILNDYIRTYYGSFIVIKKVEGSFLAGLSNGDRLDQSLTRNMVMGRVEHGVNPGWVDFFIDEVVMRRHCALFGYGYSEFKEELRQRFRVICVKKDMLANTRGPNMRVNALQICRKEDEIEKLVPEAKISGEAQTERV